MTTVEKKIRKYIYENEWTKQEQENIDPEIVENIGYDAFLPVRIRHVTVDGQPFYEAVGELSVPQGPQPSTPFGRELVLVIFSSGFEVPGKATLEQVIKMYQDLHEQFKDIKRRLNVR